MAKLIRESLTDVLFKKGLLTKKDVEKAKEHHRDNGDNFAETLIKMGLLTEEEVVQGLAGQLGVPYLKLTNYKLDPKVMEILSERIVRKYKVVPLAISGKILTLAIADPLNVLTIDDVKATTGYQIRTVISTASEIQEAISDFYSAKATEKLEEVIEHTEKDNGEVQVIKEHEEVDLRQLVKQTQEASIIRIVNLILSRAIRERTSDIHLEPSEKELWIRYRIDGVLYRVTAVAKTLHSPIVSRIKILSELDIAEHRLPQDGRFKVKVSDREIDFRVSTIPTRFGEKVVLRVLDKVQLTGLTLDKLGLEENVLEKYRRAISQPHGMIVLTGPTSCGKSTSLYAAIRAINSPEKNILTIEDPVEYEIKGVSQGQIHEKVGLTFPKALRALLRQDPDIIMLGEMRDTETADIGIKASLTGHLLFTTLHTNDAPGAVTRLINMGVEPYLVSDALLFVGAQRLMRRACPHCCQAYQPSPKLLKELGIEDKVNEDVVFYKAKGCSVCKDTGYRGRVAVMEALEIDDDIRALILRKASEAEIRKVALAKGMIPLRQNALAKVIRGKTTLQELARTVGPLDSHDEKENKD